MALIIKNKNSILISLGNLAIKFRFNKNKKNMHINISLIAENFTGNGLAGIENTIIKKGNPKKITEKIIRIIFIFPPIVKINGLIPSFGFVKRPTILPISKEINIYKTVSQYVNIGKIMSDSCNGKGCKEILKYQK